MAETTNPSITGIITSGGTFVGTFANTGNLPSASATPGGYAWVGSSAPYTVYQSNGTSWTSVPQPDATVITADNTGLVDVSSTLLAAVQPVSGSMVTSGLFDAKLLKNGYYLCNSLLDIDPSVNLDFRDRGGLVLVPGNNLPATTSNYPGQSYGAGAQAAFIRVARNAPPDTFNSKQAFYQRIANMNIDFTGTTQINPVYGIRIPNANKNVNTFDGDPGYTSNKQYTAGSYELMEIWNAPGTGIFFDVSSGRAYLNSVRAINCGSLNVSGSNHGIEMDNNDIVALGHWAAGGNAGFGVKIGAAAGFFGSHGNFWGNSSTRSLTTGAMFFNARKMFSLVCSEFNDWLRLDGGNQSSASNGWWRGGNVCTVVFAPFGSNYTSDGIAIDNTPNDSRLQASAWGTTNYQSLNLVGNTYTRSDANGNSAVISNVNTATDVFTSNNHGLANGTVVYIYSSNGVVGMPAPLVFPTGYFVITSTTNTFQLSLTNGGAAIDITSAGTGTINYATAITPFNVGGDMGWNYGTASQYLADIGSGAMVNEHLQISTSPNVNPYYGIIGTATMTIAAPCVVTFNAHGQVNGNRVAFTTTGALPTGVSAGVTYYVANKATNTFQLATSYANAIAGTVITTTGSQSGTHSVCFLSSRPYNVHSGGQMNYTWQDAYRNLFMVGGSGNSVHSHICLGINEAADINPNYQVEIGDNTGGTTYRNIMNGMTEFANNVQYIDSAVLTGSFTVGQTKTIAAGIPAARFTVAGGGIASGTITIATDRNATERFSVQIVGGGITALTWNISGGGTLNTGITLPGFTVGPIFAQFLYDHTNNTVYVEHVSNMGQPGWFGLTDGATISTPAFPWQQQNFFVTLGGNRTLANPTNPVDGQTYVWRITQDGTGTRTLAYGNKFKFSSGVTGAGTATAAPFKTLSTAIGAVDIITGVYDATTALLYCKLETTYS